MESARTQNKTLLLAALTLLSWLGMVIQNAVELPNLPIYRLEYLFPSLLSLLFFLGWAGINLIGGAILSVIPLPIWPFAPEQSLGHYLSHVIDGLAQLPLIGALISEPLGSRTPRPGSVDLESRS